MPAGGYGSYQYTSPEERALGSITVESYDKDQAKNLIKLNNDVSYMAAYMRKMQKGIDEANQNVIQQLQSFVNDIVVILGGGDSQGLDLGDFKYVLQMIGALLGFNAEGGVAGLLPLNAFEAVWHMLSTYIFPTDQFVDLISAMFDTLLGTLLDLFGDVPIVGEALQQLAVILTTLRDSFAPIQDALNRLFGAFGGTVDWINGEFGELFDTVLDGVVTFFGFFTAPLLDLLMPVLNIIAGWTTPFVHALTDIIDVATNIIRGITGGLDFTDFTQANFNPITVVIEIVKNLVKNGVLGISSAINAFNIVGLLQDFNLPNISIAHLFNPGGGVGPNLLVEPGFDSDDSISLGTGWIWDNTTGRTSVGCAKASGGGFARELISIPIPVSQGQKINLGVWLKWSGLTYSGSQPVVLGVVPYLDGVRGTASVQAGSTTPATNQPSFTQLTSTYTVPAGVDHICVQFLVKSTVIGGQIWFDDASAKKQTDGMPQSWIFNLIPDLDDIANFIQDVVDAIISVIRGIPFVGGTLANLLDDFGDFVLGTHDTAAQAGDAALAISVIEPQVATVQSNISTIQTQVINQSNMSISSQVMGDVNPSWVCRYPIADVAYPEFFQSEQSLFGITGPVTSGAVTAHTHDLDLTVGNAEPGAWTINQYESRGGIITARQSRKMDTFAMWARKNSAPVGINNIYFDLMRVNPDRSFNTLYSVDVSADLVTGAIPHMEYPIPGGLIVQGGEKYLIRCRNMSSVAVDVDVAGLWQQQPLAVDSSMQTSGSSLTNQSTYTTAQADTAMANGRVLPWCMLAAKNILATDISWGDDFQRSSLGEVWELLPASGDKLGIQGLGFIGYSGGGQGTKNGIFTKTVTTDRIRVDGTFTGTNVSPESGLIICSNDTMTNFVWLAANNTGVRLYTMIGTTLTQRVALARTGNDGNWSVYYDVPSNTFRVMKDGIVIPALDWTDTGNVITHGPQKRFGGARVEAVVFLLTQTKGAKISGWNIRDWEQ